MQESKESTSKRFFFVTKKIEYTALTDLKKQNRFLQKKLEIEPFLPNSFFSVGIARRDEKGILNLEPKKTKGIAGKEVLKSIKKIRGFQKLLKGTYLYAKPQPEQTPSSPLQNESKVPAPLEESIQKTVQKNKRNIIRGFVNTLKKGRQFLGHVKDTLGEIIQAVGSLRPNLNNGKLNIRVDADEIFDLVDLSSILEFDRTASQNHIEIEIVKFPAQELIIRSAPNESLAVKNINFEGLSLQNAQLRDFEIHLKRGKKDTQATMKIGSITANGFSQDSTSISSFSVHDAQLKISKKGDVASVQGQIKQCNFTDLTHETTHMNNGIMKEIDISLEQSKKERHFMIHGDELQNEGFSHQKEDKNISTEKMSSQNIDISYHQEDQNKSVQGTISDVHAYNTHVQSPDLDVEIGESELDTLDFVQKDKNIKVEAKNIESHDIHIEKEASTSSATSQDVQPEHNKEERSRLVKQMGALIDDVDAEASIPLTGKTPSRFLYGKKNTTAHIKTKIEDGTLIPGEFDIRLDKDIKSPFLIGFQGAYLDKKGRLKANISNFFDIGIGYQLAKQLGIPFSELTDISDLTESIAQQILRTEEKEKAPSPDKPQDTQDYIEQDKIKASANIHLNEGVLDVDNDTQLSFGGGEEHNHIQLEADLQKEILITLQDILLSKIDIKNQGLRIQDAELDDTQVRVSPEESTMIDADSFEAKSLSYDSDQATSKK